MKREFYAIALIFLVAFISIPIAKASAQTPIKIAVVDTDKAFKESIWGKKAIAELEKEAEEWQKKGEKLDDDLTALEEKLAKQRSFLDNKEEEQKLRNEIDSKRMEGQALVQQGNARLAEKRQELLEPILEEIKNIIKKLSIEKGFDLVLEKQLFVLYLNPELDVTNRVTVMLDEVYKEKVPEKAKEAEKPVPERSEGKGKQ